MIDIDVDLSPIMILLIFSRQLRNQKETTESPKIPPNWLLRLEARFQTTKPCIRSRDELQTGRREREFYNSSRGSMYTRLLHSLVVGECDYNIFT